MNSQNSRTDLSIIANLARLAGLIMNDDEIEEYTTQFSSIMNLFEILDKLDIPDIELDQVSDANYESLRQDTQDTTISCDLSDLCPGNFTKDYLQIKKIRELDMKDE